MPAVDLEQQLDVRAAFYRVPTDSNIADGPSRMDFTLLRQLGATESVIPQATIATAIGL